IPVFRGGHPEYAPPSASEARSHAQEELESLDGTVTRFDGPEPYLVGLERRLYETKARLIAAAQAESRPDAK
ncbi:MAG: hypothetical protein ISR77_34410, partial [Pirellulaceae bacterium]|nr:hypothetical protein [Pirellulaceae bacterium]